MTIQANILLMGSPGCGKTTTGRILAQQLGIPVIDVDDNLLEPYWGTAVSNKVCISVSSVTVYE